MPIIQIKRVYEPIEPGDGFRVLVDRLWPRGVSKEEAKLDLWAKDIAPSTELRGAFHEGEDSWGEFERAYRKELGHNATLGGFVDSVKDKSTVTLLFASRELEHNHAAVLASVLRSMLESRR